MMPPSTFKPPTIRVWEARAVLLSGTSPDGNKERDG